MSAEYILPCPSCGEKILVEARQSGQQIDCDCGTTLDIPTMTGMRALQRSEPSPGVRRPPSLWGARQRTFWVGTIITVIALSTTMLFYVNRPPITKTEDMTPFQTWLAWKFLSEGVRRPSFEINGPRIYLMRLKAYRFWMVIGLSSVALGLTVMAASALVPKRRLKRRIVRIPIQESQPPHGEPPPNVPDT